MNHQIDAALEQCILVACRFSLADRWLNNAEQHAAAKIEECGFQ